MTTTSLKIRDVRQKGWFWIDNSIIDTHGEHLGAHALAVYFALARYANNERQSAFPAIKTLARVTGISDRHVSRVLNDLEQRKLIAITQRKIDKRNDTNEYYLLTVPPEVVTTGHQGSDTQSPGVVTTGHQGSDCVSYKEDLHELDLFEEDRGSALASPPPKKKERTLPPEALQAAQQIADNIANVPGTIIPKQADLQRWAADINKLNRINGISWQFITDTITWALSDTFWCHNIGSGAAVRRHWNKLVTNRHGASAPPKPAVKPKKASDFDHEWFANTPNGTFKLT